MGETSSLVLLHAVFRHGNRTPIKDHFYPNDEYKDNDYYPYGFGELTQAGKKTMYDLGETLREKYKNFLDEKYIPCKVDCRCSDSTRAQMSLQLVLAGLYPPKDDQILKNGLNWQPITFKYLPKMNDDMFASVLSEEYIKKYKENYKKAPLEKYKEVLEYFEKHTGYKDATPREVWLTVGCISAEREWGLKIPSWIPPVYKELLEIATLEYQYQLGTHELKRLAVGEMLSKILRDTKAKINGESACEIHLYSGHDCNVAHVLTVLGMMYPHFPRYGACILFEVHKKADNSYHLKVIYSDCQISPYKLMTFPDGKDSISLEDFEKMVTNLMH